MVVMRNGRVVEHGKVDLKVHPNPRSDYTRGLLGAVPRLDSDPDVVLATVAPERAP